jgi:hypothetical protein
MNQQPQASQVDESFESCNLRQTASLTIAKSLELKTFARPKLLAGLVCSSRGADNKRITATQPSSRTNTRPVAARISLKKPKRKVLDKASLESNAEVHPDGLAATSLQAVSGCGQHPFHKVSATPKCKMLTMMQAFAFKLPLECKRQGPYAAGTNEHPRTKPPLSRLVSVSSVNSTAPVSASELDTKSGMTPRPRSALSKQATKHYPCTASSSPKSILTRKKWRLTDAIAANMARGSERTEQETSPRKRVAFSEQVTIFDMK